MDQGGDRLEALRAALREAGVDGFLLARTDMYGSEYLPAAEERVAWLTGFTGSAARVVVLPSTAALFTDGRYTLQAQDEVDTARYETPHLVHEPPATWLRAHAPEGLRLGYDPFLHLAAELEGIEKALAVRGGALVPLTPNPIDRLWHDRPAPPAAPMVNHPLAHAGESSADKRRRMLEAVRDAVADGLFVSAADGVAWLLNIRGGDIPFNPLCLGLGLLLPDERAVLLTDPAKKPAHFAFEDSQIALHPLAERHAFYAELAREGSRILVDPAVTHAGLKEELLNAGVCVVEGKEPVTGAKAKKNNAEVAGARRAHVVDGAAVSRFLARLDHGGCADELAAAAALEAERAKAGDYLGPSFDTISGAGPNGAIVHYRVSEATNRRLEPGTLYLVDSGAQYPDATTDITRTVAIGEPAAEMRRRFTLVLKGHIALAEAVFPEGTAGSQLDALARRHLWAAGLDYDHGTGHGVGSRLCVHEGPQRIAKRGGDVKLEPGMILSNEPGNYPAGAYGIRIENLMLVVEKGMPEGGDLALLGFELLTLAPIDRRLVDRALMTAAELAWLDAYHARVRARLAPELAGDDRAWLEAATAPLGAA
ncbi:MAG: aminopeptidase P family protein, partial [Alphaproteobacteria bacterium]